MTKIQIVHEIMKLGIKYVNITPEEYAKRNDKDYLLRRLEDAKELAENRKKHPERYN